MLFKTHQAFGLFSTSLVLINYTHTPVLSMPGMLALGASMITSIMPDADNPNTISAKAMLPLAWVLEMTRAKHRGVTHSLLAAAWWAWLALTAVHWRAALGPFHFSMYPVAIGAAVGYWSHLVIDLLNKEREQFFWPFKGGVAFYLVSSDGFVNALLEWVFGIAFFISALYSIALYTPGVALFFRAAHHLFPLVPLV